MSPQPKPASTSQSFFAVGGPAFNGALVVLLFGIVAFVAGSPTRESLARAASGLPGVDAPAERAEDGDPATARPGTPVALATREGRNPLADADRVVDDSGRAVSDDDADGRTGGGRTAGAAVPYEGSYGSWTEPGQTVQLASMSTRPTARTATSSSPTGSSSTGSSSTGSSASRASSTGSGRTTPSRTASRPAPAPSRPAPVPSRPAAPSRPAPAPSRPAPAPTSPPAYQAPAPPPVPTLAAVANPSLKYYGLHTKEAPWFMGEVDHIARLTGKAPNLNVFFTNFGERFPGAAVDASWARGMTPVVTWEPVIPGSPVGQPRLADIAGGRFDTYLDTWAAEAARNGKPLVIRFAHEMNGDWYPWSAGVNGNRASDYAEAWRHIHSRFEAAGASNILWMWSVNRVDWLKTDIADYYPGDEYVDWVGLSGYYRSATQAPKPTFDAVFGRTLEALRATAPGKKILLGEIAAGSDDASRVQWIRSTFDGMVAHPDIIGFAWFNDVKAEGDWRLQFSQATVDAFAAGVSSPHWGSGVLPPGMTPGARITVRTSPANTPIGRG
jgi:hypothetical protein